MQSILGNEEDQFTRNSQRIRKALDNSGEGLKLGIQGLISRLLLMDTEMKLALSGVPLKEHVRMTFDFALTNEPRVNPGGALPAQIEGFIPLPFVRKHARQGCA